VLHIPDIGSNRARPQGFLGTPYALASQTLVSYRKRTEEKEEKKGHNHPFNEECGPHCPRNEHYKGPVKKPGFPFRKKR
jgi:hypothetical protein